MAKKKTTSKPPAAAALTKKDIALAREAFQLEADGGVAAVLADDKKTAKGFRMTALSGKPIKHWLWGNLAIDLSTIQMKDKTPILRQHMHDRVVGWSESFDASSKLSIDGVFSETTQDGQEVSGLLGEGFPWQASVGANPGRIEFIEEGSSVKVNGGLLKGPGTVFRDTEITEVSFVPVGADRRTGVSRLSDQSSAEEIIAAYTIPRGAETKEAAMADDKDPVELTDADRKKIADDAREAGMKAERARVKAITEAALEGQSELAAKLIADGVDENTAMRQLLDDEKKNGAARAKERAKNTKLEDLRKDAVGDLGPSDKPPTETPKGEFSGFEPEKSEFDKEKLERFWDQAAPLDLKKEFGNKNAFVAYHKNRTAVRVAVAPVAQA